MNVPVGLLMVVPEGLLMIVLGDQLVVMPEGIPNLASVSTT